MYRFKNFSQGANKSINSAVEIAGKLGHMTVGTEHLLLGILAQGKSDVADSLKKYNMDFNSCYSLIVNVLGSGTYSKLSGEDLSVNGVECLRNAFRLAIRYGKSQAGINELFLSILQNNQSMGFKVVAACVENTDNLEKKLENICNKTSDIDVKQNESKKEYKTIEKYSKDLVDIARINPFDPCVGRDNEITRLIEILLRRRKNNPCLVGLAGVGKTAIIEGLANMIAKKQVPKEMWNKSIYSLDLTQILAGTKYRGDFEERMKNIIDEASGEKNIILFIDEIHIIATAGGAEGAIDAGNILKPALARGKIQVIGATTQDEYTKVIEKDTALERRFSKVLVEEPNDELVLSILKGLKEKYEDYHNITIKDEILPNIINLSNRYIHGRYMPDKAVDLLDESCAKAKLEGLKKVDINCLNKAVSSQTGIPVTKLKQDEIKELLTLEHQLKEKIFGQDKAINVMISSIKKWRVGLSKSDRPIATFLFLGPTGVGKTQSCKALANALFGSESALIRVDCTEYSEKNDVKKLIGAPPGYIGYDDVGKLEKELIQKPYSVVLFDEIEKAHSDLYNLLLQAMEDGFITSSKGRKINFKNTVIIMTSNLGAKENISNNIALGFNGMVQDDFNVEQLKNIVKNHFSPEFIGRIDEIVKFEPLNKNVVENITRNMIQEVAERLQEQNISMSYTDDVVKEIADTCYSSPYGARNIRNEISRRIEIMLSDNILNGEIQSGDKIELIVKKSKIIFKSKIKNTL